MPEVHIFGELVGAVCQSCEKAVSANWSVVPTSNKWRLVEGEEKGKTWIAQSSKDTEPAIWNHPIDASFACTSFNGWPQFLIEVYQVDQEDRIDIAGYGTCFIPCSPGLHKLKIPLFIPRGTKWELLTANFLGGYAQYEDSSVVLKSDSRFLHRTVSIGYATLEISVVLKGFPENVEVIPKKDVNASVCNGCKINDQ